MVTATSHVAVEWPNCRLTALLKHENAATVAKPNKARTAIVSATRVHTRGRLEEESMGRTGIEQGELAARQQIDEKPFEGQKEGQEGNGPEKCAGDYSWKL